MSVADMEVIAPTHSREALRTPAVRESAAARSRAATRGRLLSAGRNLFAQRGLHRVTTHDIARMAGVASGTFYLHFTDKRELFRGIFDGRYKFNRYFSTLQHNQPQTFEELTAVNDLELFDHNHDPHEMVNLATDPAKNKRLIMAMNTKMNSILKEEVGVDDGSSMALGQDTDYAFSKVDI